MCSSAVLNQIFNLGHHHFKKDVNVIYVVILSHFIVIQLDWSHFLVPHFKILGYRERKRLVNLEYSVALNLFIFPFVFLYYLQMYCAPDTDTRKVGEGAQDL